MSALEAENGFVTPENCFVGTRRRNIRFKMSNVFRMKAQSTPRKAEAPPQRRGAKDRALPIRLIRLESYELAARQAD
jgi:hypothetical protein